MSDNSKNKNRYFKTMFTEFGAFALAISFFFAIYRFDLIVAALSRLSSMLRPFIIGGALAYLLSKIAGWVEKRLSKLLKGKHDKLSKYISIACAMLLAAFAVYLLLIMIIPQLYVSIKTLIDTVPGKATALYQDLENRYIDNPIVISYMDSAYNYISEAVTNWAKDSLLPNLGNYIGGVSTGVKVVVVSIKDIAISVIVTAYCLSERKMLARQSAMVIKACTNASWEKAILEEIRYADKMFYSFLGGKIIDSIIMGILCYIFCYFAAMPNPLLIAVIVGVTNIIPFFGPFIGAIPSGLLILIENPYKALIFAVFILVLQQIDGNIIGPKILGSSTGLTSFWVLFAILLFGGTMGFVGMIIGVPLFAVIYDIIRKLVHRGIERRARQDAAIAAAAQDQIVFVVDEEDFQKE